MPIDSQIPLMGQAPQPYQAAGQVMSLRNAVLQNDVGQQQLQALQMENQQRQIALRDDAIERAAYLKAYGGRANGTPAPSDPSIPQAEGLAANGTPATPGTAPAMGTGAKPSPADFQSGLQRFSQNALDMGISPARHQKIVAGIVQAQEAVAKLSDEQNKVAAENHKQFTGKLEYARSLDPQTRAHYIDSQTRAYVQQGRLSEQEAAPILAEAQNPNGFSDQALSMAYAQVQTGAELLARDRSIKDAAAKATQEADAHNKAVQEQAINAVKGMPNKDAEFRTWASGLSPDVKTRLGITDQTPYSPEKLAAIKQAFPEATEAAAKTEKEVLAAKQAATMDQARILHAAAIRGHDDYATEYGKLSPEDQKRFIAPDKYDAKTTPEDVLKSAQTPEQAITTARLREQHDDSMDLKQQGIDLRRETIDLMRDRASKESQQTKNSQAVDARQAQREFDQATELENKWNLLRGRLGPRLASGATTDANGKAIDQDQAAADYRSATESLRKVLLSKYDAAERAGKTMSVSLQDAMNALAAGDKPLYGKMAARTVDTVKNQEGWDDWRADQDRSIQSSIPEKFSPAAVQQVKQLAQRRPQATPAAATPAATQAPAQPAKPASAPKIATSAQVDAYAAAKKISKAKATKEFQDSGYQVQ